MKLYSTLFILFLSFASLSAVSQENIINQYPKDYFRSPLSLPPQASGSFGELRSNHFHSGTDYRTNQRTGHPVYAVADGFISRIRVQIGGGGNALYIDHPNGYTSVYMHLLEFNGKIAEAARNKQYAEQRFDIDFPPEKSRVQVKKGDIIALSGNSGGSSGPHLHFELRDTKTEMTINPQLFGLSIPDNIPPIVSGFTIYRLGDAPFSENTPREHLQITGNNGNYKLSPASIIRVNGKTGFGIVAIDPNSASANKNGIYSIELLLDNNLIFTSTLSGLYFNHSRAINSYIDYATYIFKGRRIQKGFVEPGNPLTIYSHLVNKGLIDLKDTETHEMTYRIKDVKGNTSTIHFSVRFDPDLVIDQNIKSGAERFAFDQENTFSTKDVKLHIPSHSLYSDLYFTYSKSAKPSGVAFSEVHHIHNRMIPLHNGYTLSINADELPMNLQSKALIIDSRGYAQGGTYLNGVVTAKIKEFGSFHIGVDTQAPSIRALNISENKAMAGISRMNFKISDNLSGIQSFNGYIDGQWVLMEFDAKSASLWHIFDKSLSKGKHHFKLDVKDGKGNTKTYEVNFTK